VKSGLTEEVSERAEQLESSPAVHVSSIIECDCPSLFATVIHCYLRLAVRDESRRLHVGRSRAQFELWTFGYDQPVGESVYGIDVFPDDDLLWRIEWISGVSRNPSVASDPMIDVCLAQLPAGERNPLSEGSRSSQTKTTVKVGVGLLPYISIASVWQRRRPVGTDLLLTDIGCISIPRDVER